MNNDKTNIVMKMKNSFVSANNKLSKNALIAIIVVVVLFVIFGGCFFFANKTLKCTMDDSNEYMKADVKYDIKFLFGEARSAHGEATVKVLNDELDFKDTIVSSFSESFKELEDEYGVKTKIKETSDGVKITFDLKDDDFGSLLSLENEDYDINELKSTLEDEGYTCKIR